MPIIVRGSGGGGGSKPELTVTAPTGSTVICTKGTKTVTAQEDSGTWLFKLPEFGEWTVTATRDDDSSSNTVDVQQNYSTNLTFTNIYGISRDVTLSSPEWTRTDASVGKTATASVGTVAGASDFDSCYPWSGIQRETLSTGDVMLKIPKFWYQRHKDGNIEHIRIADSALEGFTLHPAFNHAGIEKDCVYVGAYTTSSNNKSVTGAVPQVSQTRATFRTNAKAKGDGWSLIDIAAVSAIRMLILVEFANNNVQTLIGRGYCDGNTAKLNTGTCDNVPNLTGRPAGTDGKVNVVWRGLEGFWGNTWEFADGINANNGTVCVCNDPSKYADDTSANYTALSFSPGVNLAGAYITVDGIDTGNNTHIMFPSTVGGSESTGYCDACWMGTGWRIYLYGGSWSNSSMCGLFTDGCADVSSYATTSFGSRLQYIPQ